MKITDIMKDERSKCYSIMIKLKVKEYLDIIKESYERNGNIEGQRIPIQSKTGKRIRDIMITDIERGTILPPIVLGCVTNKYGVENIGEYVDNYRDFNINDLLYGKSLSIIDGMQRTTALQEVIKKDENKINEIIGYMDLFVNKLTEFNMEELGEFIDIDTFNEITEKMGKIDLVEFYKNAFSDLVESRFEIKSMQQCWRA